MKLNLSSISTCLNADSTSASALGSPYFFCKSFSSEPAFTPTLIGTLLCFAAAITSLIFASFPIFPGLSRKQSAASATYKAIL